MDLLIEEEEDGGQQNKGEMVETSASEKALDRFLELMKTKGQSYIVFLNEESQSDLKTISLHICKDDTDNSNSTTRSSSSMRTFNWKEQLQSIVDSKQLSACFLDLSWDNIIDACESQYIPSFISSLSSDGLTSLTLNASNTFVKGNHIETLCRSIQQLNSLLTLDLNLFQNNTYQLDTYKYVSDLLSAPQFSNLLSLTLVLPSQTVVSTPLTTAETPQELVSLGLSNLHNLKTLNLTLIMQSTLARSTHKLNISSFSDELSTLITLSSLTLDLQDNSIDQRGIECLSYGIGHLLNLTSLSLNLSNNMIDSYGLDHLSLGIKILDDMRSLVLNISRNQIKVNAILEFTKILSEMKSIEHLNLNFNENNNRKITASIFFYEQIEKMTQLKSLELAAAQGKDIKITQESVEEFQQSLNHLGYPFQSTVYELFRLAVLQGFYSFSKTTPFKPTNLPWFPDIQELDTKSEISLNCQSQQLRGHSAFFILKTIADYTKLQSLSINFSFNNAYLPDFDLLATAIPLLVSLTSLDFNLRRNNLKGTGTLALTQAISQLHNLRTLKLNLKENNLGDIGIQSLCECITALTNLKVLCLEFYYQPLNESQEIERFTNAIASHKNIIYLSLHIEYFNHIRTMNTILRKNKRLTYASFSKKK